MGEFVTVGKSSNVPEGEFLVAEVDGQNVVVAHVGGEFYAIGEECPHAGGPLGDGTLDGCEIECPWHASRFDVRTGEVLWETRLGTAAQGFPSLRARLDQASGQCRHLPLNYSVPFLSLDSIMFSTFSGVRYAPSPAPAKYGKFRYCASRNSSSGYGFGVFMASSIASTTWLASS